MAFQKNYDCKIFFAMRRGEEALSQVSNTHTILTPKGQDYFDYLNWLEDCIEVSQADILVLDVRDGLKIIELQALKESGLFVVTIDDPEEKRLAVDLAFYPPVPQVKELDWSGFKGIYFSGWEYTIVNTYQGEQNISSDILNTELLISMGWSDPAELTLLALKAMEIIENPIKVSLVVGGGFGYKDKLRSKIKISHHQITIIENPKNLVPFLKNSQLALISFGVTAYEAASLRIPSIIIGLTEDHVRSASAFHEAGIGLNMGLYNEVELNKLAHAISSTLSNKDQLIEMSNTAAKLNCGNTTLIADEIGKHSGYYAG
jgi:spore coat polysaccharide biosynthesis predicted glycosyltransferase SpsG